MRQDLTAQRPLGAYAPGRAIGGIDEEHVGARREQLGEQVLQLVGLRQLGRELGLERLAARGHRLQEAAVGPDHRAELGQHVGQALSGAGVADWARGAVDRGGVKHRAGQPAHRQRRVLERFQAAAQ